MNTKMLDIYHFTNGTRLDLSKIICIGAIDKDEHYNIIIPVYVTGMDKPIKFICANAIGKVSDEQKDRVQKTFNALCLAWDQWKKENGKEEN